MSLHTYDSWRWQDWQGKYRKQNQCVQFTTHQFPHLLKYDRSSHSVFQTLSLDPPILPKTQKCCNFECYTSCEHCVSEERLLLWGRIYGGAETNIYNQCNFVIISLHRRLLSGEKKTLCSRYKIFVWHKSLITDSPIISFSSSLSLTF